MDFISLATEHRRFLRILDEMLGDDNDDRTTSTAAAIVGAGALASAAPYAEGSSMDTVAARPLFSKNAEAELYMLATNFLLYVALVIVVILVCRIYFPEALESRGQQPRPRNYNYRVAEAQEVEEDYSSDDEDRESDDILDSGDDEGVNPASSFFDFQQDKMTRKHVLQRLIFCIIMLNVTFVMWGALQVRYNYSWRIRINLIRNKKPLTARLLFGIKGTNVDASLPPLHRRILYLLVRLGIYQSLLDAHHVGNVDALLQASSEPIGCHLRVLLSLHFQHAFELVSVRGSSLRLFPCYDTL
jgi:hypothetical protein